MNNGDKPVNPVEHSYPVGHENNGITKREHFAAMAMQGLIASGEIKDYKRNLTDEQIANLDWDTEGRISLMSVSLANGLLAALEETK